MTSRAILILGLPGSGKSTISSQVAKACDGTWLSASHILRMRLNNDSGRSIAVWERDWQSGTLAPGPEVLPRLWAAFRRTARNPILLDGYPRNEAQLKDFQHRGGKLAAAILLSIDEETALNRVRVRSATQRRADDELTVVRRRLSREKEYLEGLLALPSTRGILHVLNANQGVPDLLSEVISLVVRLAAETGLT
jgi:adenylate kinase family enzyme